MADARGYFPIFLQLRGATALVVGGGQVALRKVRDLRAAGAKVRVVAPEACGALKRMKTVDLRRRRFRATDVGGTVMVIAATDDRNVNVRVARAANRLGIPVNVVDKPELCSFIVPAVLRRGPITVAISTGGASPAMARNLRDRVSKAVLPRDGAHAAFMADARRQILSEVADPARRKDILERLAAEDIALIIESGGPARAKSMLRDMIRKG